MILTRRGKRRLLILSGLVAVVGGLGAGLFVLRSVQRERAFAEARTSGLLAYERHDYRSALQKLSRVIARDPADLDALLACAQSRARIPEVNDVHHTQAVSLFRSVLRTDAENREALDALLGLYRHLDYRTEMVEIADRILELDADDVPALAAKARAALLEGRLDEVLTLANRLAAVEPLELSWRMLSVTTLRSQGMDQDAVLSRCDEWIAGHEGDGRFKLLKAQLLAEYGLTEDARFTLLEAAEDGAASRDVLESMLTMLDSFGFQNESNALLDDAISRAGDESWVYEAAARYHWQSLQYDEALAQVARGRERLGRATPGLLIWQAIVLSTRGRHDEALEIVEGIRDGTSDDDVRDQAEAWVHAVTAARRLAGGDWSGAIETYEQALAVDPDDAVLQYLYAQALRRLGEHDRAIEIFSWLAARQPGWLDVQVSWANSLLATGRPREAFPLVSRAVRGRPTMHAGAYLTLCDAWLRVDPSGENVRLLDTQETIELTLVELLERLHRRVGWDARATRLLAEAYANRAETEAVSALVDRALSDPTTPSAALLALADVSERWGLDLEDDLLTEASARTDSAPEVIAARAGMLERRGRVDEALAIVDEALAAAPPGSPAAARLVWTRVRLRLRAGAPDAGREVRGLLAADPRPDEALSLLAMEEAWNDAALVRAVIDQLETTLGAGSIRVRFAEAQYLYRHGGDDPTAIDRAQAMIRTILQDSPWSKPALTLQAQLQLAADPPRLEEAAQAFRTAVDAHPDELSFYAPLIGLLQQQGDFAAADRYIERFAERAGDAGDSARLVVELLERQGEADRAARRLTRMVNAQSPAADQLWLASLLARAGNPTEAEAILERLLMREAPGNEVVLAAARFRAAQGRLDEAVALVAERLQEPDEAVRSRQIALVLLGAGAAEDAEDYLRRAVEIDPNAVESWSALARLHVARGELDLAGEAIQRGLAVAPQNASLNAMLAVTQVSGGATADRAQVTALLGELGRASPAAERVILLLDRLDEPRAEDLAEARSLVQDHPELVSAWRLAVDLHAAAGRWDDAVGLARQAVGRLPTRAEPAEMATRLLIRIGRTEEALAMVQTWRRRTLAAPMPADTVIAALLIDAGRAESAHGQLAPYSARLWNERDRFPDRVEVWLTALLAAGKDLEAEALVDRLLADGDGWSDCCLRVAGSLEPDRARAQLERLGPLLEAQPGGRLQLALAWHDLARRASMDEAYAQAEGFATTAGQDPEAAYGAGLVRASIAADRGDLTLAEDLYRTALAAQPDSILVLNNLASVLIRLGTRCDEAVALADRARMLSNDEPGVIDTLALAHLCAGQLDRAESLIESVMDAGAEHPAFYLTRARVRHAQDRPDDALEDLERARRGVAARRNADPDLRRQLDEVQRLIVGEPAAALSPSG